MKKETRKNLLKGLKRIKWENIYLLLHLVITFICLRHHIKLNGLYLELGLEIVIYSMFGVMFRYIIKDIRKNPSNWFFD